MRFATMAQVAALADAIGPRYRALVLVAAYGGLRWGELVGLRVKRVDLLHGRVTVAEQVSEVNGQLIPGPPKTEAGRRTVTLPAVAAAALAEHLAEYAEPGPDGLVFPAPESGYLRRSNPSGRLWHGRYPLAPTLRAVSFEADRAAQVLIDPGVAVVPIVAVHGAQVPWGKLVVDGVPVVPARRLPSMLRQLPAVLGCERIAAVADQARVRFRAAA